MLDSERFQMLSVAVPKNTALAVAAAYGTPLPPALGTARDNKTGQVMYPAIPMTTTKDNQQ